MIFIIMGLLIGGLAIPLVLGKIPPNRWYGIRFPAAYKSPENWYKINRFGGWVIIVWSIGVVGEGLIPWSIKWPAAILLLVAPFFLVMVAVMIMAIYVNKIDKP